MLVTDAPMSFFHLFICSVIEVYSSSSSTHVLFFLVFTHRILLHLGLEDFPASEPVHIIAPIGATFLWQRTAQMQASSKCPRVDSSSSGVAPPLPPPSTGDPVVDAFVDLPAATTPPPSTSDVSSIRHTLDTVMTVQVAHGQLLVDMLTKLQALRADLASIRRTPPPPPFNDE